MPKDKVILEVKNLSRMPNVNNVSFALKRGEILGFAGLVGAGRTELMRLVFGADSICLEITLFGGCFCGYGVFGSEVALKV